MKVLIVALLCLASAVCFIGAWISNARNTIELDRLGKVWCCKRWPGETNNSYHQRLQARIGFR